MKKQQKQNSLIFTYAWQQARGKCYYFQETSHKVYMETLIQAKCSNLKLAANDGVTREEPLGFRNCEKCSRMAEELGLFAWSSEEGHDGNNELGCPNPAILFSTFLKPFLVDYLCQSVYNQTSRCTHPTWVYPSLYICQRTDNPYIDTPQGTNHSCIVTAYLVMM